MNPSTLSVLLLAGALQAALHPPWYVGYPKPFCVVEGSTTTIPCSFTYPKFLIRPGEEHQVKRVVWCPNHEICQGNTFYVYNSSNISPDSRFQYLGNLTGNCTLQIMKTSKRDAATYRFRMETNANLYTGREPGVRITVTDGADVKVSSSIRENKVRRGGQVTLTCTSACSFHQLDVHWSRNGHALSETGPTLHLSDLTSCDTGNYTCSVDSSRTRTSVPWSLVVEDDGNCYSYRGVYVAMGVLVGVIVLTLAGFVFAKRRHSAKKLTHPKGVDSKQEVMGAPEEVSYSAVHFKPHPSRSARGQEEETVYSQVVR